MDGMLPLAEGSNPPDACGVVSGAQAENQIGREDMSRSAHTFLPKNKLVAGMGIGAIAMLAVAVPALGQPEGPGDNFKKDEVFQVTTVMQVPGAAAFFS